MSIKWNATIYLDIIYYRLEWCDLNYILIIYIDTIGLLKEI